MAGPRRVGIWIALLVVLAAAAFTFGWWTWYVRTPEYSIRMMGRAVDRGDWQAFVSYVDTERLVSTAVQDEIDRRLPPDDSPEIARRLALAAKPRLVEAAEAGLREAIERRAGRGRDLPAIAYALAPAEIRRLSDAEASHVRYEAVLPFRGRRVPVRMRLVRAGDRWRVVEVEDVDRLLDALGFSL